MAHTQVYAFKNCFYLYCAVKTENANSWNMHTMWKTL